MGGLRRGDTGQAISRSKPGPCSFIVYWDADPLSELLDRTTISKWTGSRSGCARCLRPTVVYG